MLNKSRMYRRASPMTVTSATGSWRATSRVIPTFGPRCRRDNDAVLASSAAATDDPVFGDKAYAYKLKATSHILSLGLSKEINRRCSLNVGVQRQLTYAAGGYDYYGSVFNVTYLYGY